MFPRSYGIKKELSSPARRLVKNGHLVEHGGCFGGAVGQKPNWSSVEREQGVGYQNN